MYITTKADVNLIFQINQSDFSDNLFVKINFDFKILILNCTHS